MAGSMPNGIAYDDKGWHDAGLDAHWAWERLCTASNLSEQNTAFNQLFEAMTVLATWLPGYDYEHHEVTDPRPDA